MKSNRGQRVNKYFVYAHYKKTNNELFYIGKGKIAFNKKGFPYKKNTTKYPRAYHFKNRNKFWLNIFSKHGVIVKILKEFKTESEALKEEEKLIKKFGRRFLKQGSLSNISTGGYQGPVGKVFKMSEEQKRKLSDMKSINLYVYNKFGVFIKTIKTIKKTAEFCGVTYNAIHSCMNTKNYSNGFFIFREFKGNSLGYTYKDLNFKSTLSKKLIVEDNLNNKKIFDSIADCAKGIKGFRSNIQRAIKNNKTYKGYKIYLMDNQQRSL